MNHPDFQHPPYHSQTSTRLIQLKKMLQMNRLAVEQLKKARDIINSRMKAIDEYITTLRLKSQYPPATWLISHIKYERIMCRSYIQQALKADRSQPIKKINEQECQFIKRLGNGQTNKKKKQLTISLLPNHPKEIDFQQLAKTYNFKTGIQIYRAWNDHRSEKIGKRPFNIKEEEIIIQKQQIYGCNWEKICNFLQTRTFEQIYYEFHNRINPKIKSGRWTVRQSLMLIVLLQHYGNKHWSSIAEKMKIKNQLQVRERYCNIINPSIGKDTWTAQMQQKLMQVAVEQRYCWKNIARLSIFNNKTDNCIWRKYRSLMVFKTKQEIMEQCPDVNNRKLADKILKYKQMFDSRKRAPSNQPKNITNSAVNCLIQSLKEQKSTINSIKSNQRERITCEGEQMEEEQSFILDSRDVSPS